METITSTAAFLLLSFLLCPAPNGHAEQPNQPTPASVNGKTCLTPQERARYQKVLHSRKVGGIFGKLSTKISDATGGIIGGDDINQTLTLPDCPVTPQPAPIPPAVPAATATTPAPVSK